MAIFTPGRLLRRLSSRGDTSPNNTGSPPPSTPASSALPSPSAKIPAHVVKSSPKLRKKFGAAGTDIPEVVIEQRESFSLLPEAEGAILEEGEVRSRTTSGSETLGEGRGREALVFPSGEKTPEVSTAELELEEGESPQEPPVVVVEGPTPDVVEEVRKVQRESVDAPQESTRKAVDEGALPAELPEDRHAQQASDRPVTALFSPETLRKGRQHTEGPIRRPSLLDSANAKIVKTLLDSPFRNDALPTSDGATLATASSNDLFSPGISDIRAMVQRKIWVKRPGASATLVQIREDDLVDDVREMILRKYANSLGKTFDAPDMTISIATRAEHGTYRNERTLGPEEEMCRTIDSYYPGGQTVDEALIINVPQRRTPRPSPKVFSYSSYQALEDYRPLENGTDYFPPMPAVIPATIPQTSSSHDSRSSQHHHPSVAAPAEHPRSISVLNTGQIPPLPSPGGTSRRHHSRPKYHRQPISSPNILSHPNAGAVVVNPPTAVNPPAQIVHRASTRPRLDSSAASEAHAINGIAPVPPALPTPPAQEAPPTNKNSNPPTPSGTSTNPHTMPSYRPGQRPRRSRKPAPEDRATSSNRSKNGPYSPSVSTALANAAVPPISVLIVEDNIINLRILEGLMKRLKVRWATAMNGQIAVDKWKAGGFHLVLMDIQMPVMSGLQAAREIRRLERVNGIGVFGELESPLSGHNEKGGAATNGDTEGKGKAKSASDDKLQISEGLFKSPVIIVALTASSLQSDRHEALAAGCNDFLNKPVSLVWLERKVKEWGCMQALIDYDGWRKWKDYAAEQEAGRTEEERQKEREKQEKAKLKAEKMAKLQEKQALRKKVEERWKWESFNAGDGAEGGSGGVGGGGGLEGVNEATAALKRGAECLKDCNFELG